ncbi:MAG: hypothetical protein ACJ76H_10115 [Bacteriovoracaceae bacterium]
MKTLLHGLLALSLTSASVFACTMDGKEGIVEENNLRIPVSQKSINGITEEQFNAVIDEVVAVMSPIVKSHGGELQAVKLWEDETVNAYAEQEGTTWKVSMFGGLARHETITRDGMALVVCHEIGHHIGGAPLYSWKSGWASTEGQADYFATTKCLRQVWLKDNNEEIVSHLDVPAKVKQMCGKHLWNADYAVCIRGAMAGDSVSRLFAALRQEASPAKFDTPDPAVVKYTNENHPGTQCRLDTYFQGALCDIPYTEEFSRDSEVTGACHKANGHKIGLRPLCWFKPLQ